MIFNDQVLHKDRLDKVSDNVDFEVRMLEVVHLKDFLVNKLQVNVCDVQETTPLEDPEYVTPKINNYTPVIELRRSFRAIRPP